MVRRSFMLIAGETSGDLLGAELVRHLRAQVTELEGQPSADRQPLQASLEPEFFGAGGPHMQAADVQLAVDMTEHSVVGLWEVVKQFSHFRRVFRQLVHLALARQPDVIICIDFAGFNLRFLHAVRRYVRSRRGTFNNWTPRLVQYVSPQVWASRPQRAKRLAQDCDLLLSLLPFEKQWYAAHAPKLPVIFVGHPIVDRHAGPPAHAASSHDAVRAVGQGSPHLVLLPGSRIGELKRHLSVMLEAVATIQRIKPDLHATMVLPNERLLRVVGVASLPATVKLHAGKLSAALQDADVAIASTGTVTLECAYFGVPTVALYKTSPLTYWVAARMVQVKFLAMPNILANEEILPEFIQDAATAANLARAALDLIDSPVRRAAIQSRLASVIQSVGPPGASARAAGAIVGLLESQPRPLRASLSG